MNKYIEYFATPYGYTVRVFDDSGVVDEYSAGNSGLDSQTYLSPDDSQAVDLDQLNRWARQTAEDMAAEHAVPLDRLEYDADLAEDEIATRRAMLADR